MILKKILLEIGLKHLALSKEDFELFNKDNKLFIS